MRLSELTKPELEKIRKTPILQKTKKKCLKWLREEKLLLK